MFKTVPALPRILFEWASILNAEFLRREPRVIGVVDDGSELAVRFVAPIGVGWVQVHVQSTAAGEGGISGYDASNYKTSTEVDCRQDRLQDVTVTLAAGEQYAVYLIPVHYSGAGTKVLYDGESGRPDNMASVGTLGAVPQTVATAVVYVAKTGSDSNSGLHPGLPKLTIAAALTVASGLLGGSVERVRVEVLDGGTYDEDLTVPAGVLLHGPAAIIVGEMTLTAGGSGNEGASVNIHTHYAETTATATVLLSGSSGRAHYQARVLDTRGTAGTLTGVIGIVNGTSGGILLVDIDILFVGEDSGGIADAVDGSGHIHFNVKDLYLAGDDAVGMGPFSSGSNLIGYIDHILEDGSPSDTIAISSTVSGSVIKVVAAEIIADEVWNISAGDVYVVCPKLTGTRTGTPLRVVDGITISQETTGGGSAALGANCPASTVAAPYTWMQMLSADGSTVYVPAWK